MSFWDLQVSLIFIVKTVICRIVLDRNKKWCIFVLKLF